jgi:hypothetical protein
MINQTSTNPPSYTQHPFVYSAANAYANAIPWTAAATSALFTPGNRVDKMSAGAGSLSYWLGFQQVSKWYNRGLERFYEKHPKVADTVNQNPIMLGMPLILLGLVPEMIAGMALETGTRMALEHPTVAGGFHKMLHSDTGNHLAKPLGRFERKVNRPVVVAALGIGLTVLTAVFLIRALMDAARFGHDYRQARKQNPYKELSPYDLKAAILNPATNQVVRTTSLASASDSQGD